jgi:hypothetical protein
VRVRRGLIFSMVDFCFRVGSESTPTASRRCTSLQRNSGDSMLTAPQFARSRAKLQHRPLDRDGRTEIPDLEQDRAAAQNGISSISAVSLSLAASAGRFALSCGARAPSSPSGPDVTPPHPSAQSDTASMNA